MDALIEFARDPRILAWMQLAGLTLGRCTPLFVMTPMLGGQAVPLRARMAVIAVLSSGLILACARDIETVHPADEFVLLMAKELLIGLTLGLIVLIVFEAFAAFGALVDRARGEGNLTAQDPFYPNAESMFALFCRQAAVAFFLVLGGHRVVLEKLGESFVVLPSQEAVPAWFFDADRAVQLIQLSATLFTTAFRLAAPLLVLTFAVDVSMALAARVAQRMDISAPALAAKGLLVLCALLLTSSNLLDDARREFGVTMNHLDGWLRGSATGG